MKQKFSRDFNLVLIGQIISLFGASILKFSLSLYILDITGSAVIFGSILAISSIPILIFSPIGGAIADRFNKRNLMVIFDFTSCFIITLLALALFMDKGSVIIVGIIMTALSVISTMYQPVVQASIPILTDEKQLFRANGLVSSVSALTSFLGPIVGALLYGALGINSIVIMSAVSFFFSAVMEIFIHIPFEKTKYQFNIIKTIASDMKEGFLYIIKNDSFIVKAMSMAAILNLFVTPLVIVGLPYIIKIFLGLSSQHYGFTQGALGIGMILGAISIGSVSKKLQVKTIYKLVFILAICLLPISFVTTTFFNIPVFVSYSVITISAIIIMFFVTILNIYVLTAVQKKTPNALLGKVMAILIAVSNCAAPIGQALFGALFEMPNQYIFIVVFGVALISFITAIITKKITRNESEL